MPRRAIGAGGSTKANGSTIMIYIKTETCTEEMVKSPACGQSTVGRPEELAVSLHLLQNGGSANGEIELNASMLTIPAV